ncbi:hypothetical protein CP981_26105 [Streptomyces platensis]|uniref:Uncharacterized protein n=1 Tax=Streptomyces platensis TaxID=58346 RepID=A0AAE6NL74_STRPT|nr:hypothetical protein [Streptomyces platensis]OSY47578.1 hypothetical protein BG653_00833 [Streptomyces platensis]QEV54643.1 hypothetical protein CP981_26105 [Streptomyces platensis]
MDMKTWREGRKSADDAVAAIREAFSALGLSEAFGRGVRPVVTHSGKAYVDLGMLRADQVEQAANAICAAGRHQ